MIPPTFAEAIRAQGMEPPYDIEVNKFYRMPGIDKNLNNRAGWCILFEGGKSGCFGDWSTGLSENWQADRMKHISQKERAKFAQRVREARREAADDQKEKHAEAALNALSIYTCSVEAPLDFPYLVKKRIKANNARMSGSELVLPIKDFFHNITSLQFIAGNGEKRMLKGGRKKGCYISLNDQYTNPSTIIICEGWATGATLAENHPEALVLAAIDAGNLKSVATGASLTWPKAELIIAGDDDRSKQVNVGAEKAREAARLTGAKLALPQWPEGAPLHLSDFNDLAVYLEQVAA
jgi:putative DNA primase/helicase